MEFFQLRAFTMDNIQQDLLDRVYLAATGGIVIGKNGFPDFEIQGHPSVSIAFLPSCPLHIIIRIKHIWFH